MTKYLENPPNRIRDWRIKRRLTLAEFSERTGIDAAYISKMELGDRRETLLHLRKMAKILRVNVGQLLNSEDNPDSLSENERLVVDTMRGDKFTAHMIVNLAHAAHSFSEN
jgi:transcriptional regulator with XRE-family HTH domain